MDESASRKEIVISDLKNWSHHLETSAYVILTLAYLIVNRDSLPIDMQLYLILEIIAGISFCGIYTFSVPYKYGIHKLMCNIDEICDERKDELTSEFYERTEKIVYFLFNKILPLDTIFFLITYNSMSVITVIYNIFYLDGELNYEKFFRMLYLLYLTLHFVQSSSRSNTYGYFLFQIAFLSIDPRWAYCEHAARNRFRGALVSHSCGSALHVHHFQPLHSYFVQGFRRRVRQDR